MDDDNFFAVEPQDGAPPAAGADDAGAPPASAGDFFGAPPAATASASAVASDDHIGDVNETDNAFATAPSGDATTDAFALPPPGDDAAEGDDAIILMAPPPEAPVDDDDDIAPVDAEEEEADPIVPTGPSPMSKWNDEWQETLKQRKNEENDKNAEMLEAARLALENFQKEREMKRESKMASNREDEQAKLEAIEADLENDNSWQRVCKMVELSHDSTDATEDVKRMRDALIYLKNDTARAEVLGS